ncbi:MAG: metalloregulator ArsR/SmtB family transcription factor [Clostridiales bacterium]|nr:metalloregulator ArsR/SmtB family transcription factor [Clostridiales bacterium]
MDKTNLPSEEVFYDMADFFKMFGDASRIKILYTLYTGEMSVSELVNVLDMNQSAVSHQLRILRQSDLVKFRKDGKAVIYSLDDSHVFSVLEQGLKHIAHKNGLEENEYEPKTDS